MVSLEEMDLAERVRAVSSHVAENKSQAKGNEQATKTSLIRPFIERVLGYDMSNLNEVRPEFTATWGVRNNARVDYAIMKDGKPIILIECKAYGVELETRPPEQLAMYFHPTEVHLGILTDGVIYRFYSDLENSNVMDKEPFLEINLQSIGQPDVGHLNVFFKGNFDPDGIRNTARDFRDLRAIKEMLESEWTAPSEAFAKHFMARVHRDRKQTKKLLKQFDPLFKRAYNEFKDSKGQGGDVSVSREYNPKEEEYEPTLTGTYDNSAVTAEGALKVVKEVLKDSIDIRRVNLRRYKSVSNIRLGRRVICRLHFNGSKKSVSFWRFSGEERNEERVVIGELDDIRQYADLLRETISHYKAARRA